MQKTYIVKGHLGPYSDYKIQGISNLLEFYFWTADQGFSWNRVEDLKNSISSKNNDFNRTRLQRSTGERHGWFLTGTENIDLRDKLDMSIFIRLYATFANEFNPVRMDRAHYLVMARFVMQSMYTMSEFQKRELKKHTREEVRDYKINVMKSFYDARSYLGNMDKKIKSQEENEKNMPPLLFSKFEMPLPREYEEAKQLVHENKDIVDCFIGDKNRSLEEDFRKIDKNLSFAKNEMFKIGMRARVRI